MNEKQQRVNILRSKSRADHRASSLRNSIHFNGNIRARELPFETEQEWRHWWLGEFNSSGQMIRAPRMSDREKDKYTVAESSNILVSNGITNILSYIGSNAGGVFAQQFAVGNIAIASVNSNDTALAGEYFRAAPSASNVSGVQLDLSTLAGTTQANGIITNVGLWGNGATGTMGSGTMMTHSLFNYTKLSTVAISFDYLISYS